ncbi:hypothetical protein PTKIN_Ptkin01aG0245200 [Pterospermum kingtungense]
MIWSNRNECYHNGRCKFPSSLVTAAKIFLEDYMQAAEVHGSLSLVIWHPPSAEKYKLNVDASYEMHSSVAALGVVLRDSCSFILFSAGMKVSGVNSVLQTELWAIRIIADTIDLSLELQDCSFNHIGRSGNRLADAISRSAYVHNGSMV